MRNTTLSLPAPLAAAALGVALATAGCGGGGDEQAGGLIDRLRDEANGVTVDPATTLAVGTPANGSLGPGDEALGDGSLYDQWTYRGTAGERVAFVMESADFDAHLAVGTGSGPEMSVLGMDDDGGGGTDARVELVLPRSATYSVRANSLQGDETGSYTLRVDRLGANAGPEVGEARETRGSLADGDLMAGGRPVDVVPLTGRAGQRLVVQLNSTDFDAVITVMRQTPDGDVPVQANDDGGAGTNAKLDILLPADGEYRILVHSLNPAGRGDYTLRVATS